MNKSLMLIAALVLLTTFQAIAQPGFARQKRKISIEERIAALHKVLNLNEQQRQDIEHILKEHDKQLNKIIEENRNNRRAIQAAINDLQEQTQTQISNLLDDNQKEKYKNYLKKQQEQREKRQSQSQRRPGNFRGRR